MPLEELRHQIRREGPVPYSTFVRAALYGPDGFYTSGGGAGRRRDFLTSPEVGSLFGAVVGRALDAWWDQLGQPDPYLVVEAGAGPGALAQAVLRSSPRCNPALRYVLVESSSTMQQAQRGRKLPLVEPAQLLAAFVAPDDDEEPIEGLDDAVVVRGQGPLCCALDALPAMRVHVILANELLDNLPFDVAARTHEGWQSVRVGLSDEGAFVEQRVSLDRLPAWVAPAEALPVGSIIPVLVDAVPWIREAREALQPGGRLVCIDYAATTAELASRGRGWLRTFRGHTAAGDPLTTDGTADVTHDVPTDQIAAVARLSSVTTQADFLRAHGIDVLVDEAQRYWEANASTGNLDALRARSWIGEAPALLDPDGLGGFTVFEWRRGDRP